MDIDLTTFLTTVYWITDDLGDHHSADPGAIPRLFCSHRTPALRSVTTGSTWHYDRSARYRLCPKVF
jgi:hypothetical protein